MNRLRNLARAMDGRDALTGLGVLLVACGVALVSASAALIAVGAFLLYLGVWHPLLLHIISARR